MTVSDMGWIRGCESASSFMRLPPHEPALCETLRWLAAEILRYSMPINKLRGNKQSKHCHRLNILHPSSAKGQAQHCLLASREQQELTHSGGAQV